MKSNNTAFFSVLQPVKHRLLLGIGILSGLLCLLVLTAHLELNKKSQQVTTQRLHLDLAYNILADQIIMDNNLPNQKEIKKLFENLMILGPNFEFYILDNDGNVLAHSMWPTPMKTDTINMEPVQQFIKGTRGNEPLSLPLFGDNPINGEKALFSAAPIMVDNFNNGVLYVVLGSKSYSEITETVASDTLQQQVWATLVPHGLFLLALFFTLSFAVTRPLKKLASSVQGHQLSKDNTMTQTWNPKSANEFEKIGTALKAAHEQISTQYFQLQQRNDLRKELLAHVSHDLRTPMASILGYLETYLIHENLPDDKKREYVEVAKKNALKTNRLLEQLFELAYLDQDNIVLNLEQFPIAELLQDIAATCAVKAREKNINIQIVPKDLSILVSGDIEKLDRVVTNLLENAIRHTPENGKITMRVRTTKEEVIIAVKDTGCGISEENIPHIFEAHFKGDNSVRDNTAHGGLGLAITKRLLELHGSPIKVKSTISKGTVFYFRLTRATNVIRGQELSLLAKL